MPALAADPALQPYLPKIRQELTRRGYPADLPVDNVVTEALAYNTAGGVPGLSEDDSRTFLDQAMKSIPQSVPYAELTPNMGPTSIAATRQSTTGFAPISALRMKDLPK